MRRRISVSRLFMLDFDGLAMARRPIYLHKRYKARSELAQLVGDINVAWNDAHLSVYAIFAELVGDSKKAKAMFFALRTDAAQRDITTALAPVALGGEKLRRIRKEVLDFMKHLNQLASKRNDAIHSLWSIYGRTNDPVVIKASRPRLANKSVRKVLTEHRTEIKTIAFYSEDLWRRVHDALLASRSTRRAQ